MKKWLHPGTAGAGAPAGRMPAPSAQPQPHTAAASPVTTSSGCARPCSRRDLRAHNGKRRR